MLPPFDQDGALPAGVHDATWEEIRAHFGGTDHRMALLVGIRRVIDELRDAGCQGIWLDGSFVTAKEHPGDFDLCYDLASTDVSRLHSTLRTLRDRTAMKERYGGDILPTDPAMPFLEFFQTDRDGRAKGIVRVDLKSMP